MLIIFFIFIAAASSAYSAEPNEYYLSDGWTFYWNHFFTISPHYGVQGENHIKIPEIWKHDKYGYGTYCQTLHGLDPEWKYAFFMNRSPGTAASVYVNGVKCASCGTVSTTSAGSRACVMPLFVSFMPDSSGTADITIVVSNYVYRKAGLWSEVFFGRENEVRKKYNAQIFISAFIIGMLMILCIVNGIIYLLNHERKDNLLFAIMSFLMLTRIATRKFSLLMLLFHNFPYGLARKFEYLIIWAAAPVFIALVDEVYPYLHVDGKKRRLISNTGIFIGVLSFLLPIKISNYFVVPMGIIAIVSFFWFLFNLLFRNIEIRKKLAGSITSGKLIVQKESIFLSAMILFVLSGFIVEYINAITCKLSNFNLIYAMFFVFAVGQFLSMSFQQSRLYERRKNKADALRRLNEAYCKFVPVEFMKLLNKTDVVSVSLGDHIETDMAILFMMTSSEPDMEIQFRRFSSFSYSAISVIERHNGFVSKFNSCGLMALFPSGSSDAAQCARELAVCALSCGFNRIGIGVYYGKMIVGTIGEKLRLDDTVISDTVNTAFRMMEISYARNVPVIVSESAVLNIPESEKKESMFEPMDNIPVKGKKKSVRLYSLSMAETGLWGSGYEKK